MIVFSLSFAENKHSFALQKDVYFIGRNKLSLKTHRTIVIGGNWIDFLEECCFLEKNSSIKLSYAMRPYPTFTVKTVPLWRRRFLEKRFWALQSRRLFLPSLRRRRVAHLPALSSRPLQFLQHPTLRHRQPFKMQFWRTLILVFWMSFSIRLIGRKSPSTFKHSMKPKRV